MAWTESFHCDVCNKEKKEESAVWWLAWTEKLSPAEGAAEQAAIRITRWNAFLAHSADVQHLCGARCVHTITDRWMLERD